MAKEKHAGVVGRGGVVASVIVSVVVFSAAMLGADPARAEQAAPVVSPISKDRSAWPDGLPKPSTDCSCRPPGGGKAPVGAEICIRKGGEMVTMRCEMALNNTIWRQLRAGCDEPLS